MSGATGPFIQKLFTSRDNFVGASGASGVANFVGQEGRIWWDPVRNNFYYSDGETPGGLLIGTSSGGATGVMGTTGATGATGYVGSTGATGATGPVAGANTQVIFNDDNAAGASANLTFNTDTNLLTVIGNIIATSANIGNLTINDQTVAGIVSTQDVNIETLNGSANINLLGGLNVHAANLEVPPDFSVDNLGRVTILVPTPDQYTGSVNIVGSPDGSEVSPQNYGVLLQQTGQQSVPSRIYNDGVASYAAYVGRRYNGTSASPTPVLINQIMGRVAATPYVGNTVSGWPNISTARIDFVTTENQSAANNGSKIQMWATPSGTDVANIGLVADFGLGGINLTGNLIPTVDNIYSLGNVTNRWIGAYFGNAGIYIQDTTLGDTGQISLDNGVLLVDSNVSAIQVGNTQLTQSGLSSTD